MDENVSTGKSPPAPSEGNGRLRRYALVAIAAAITGGCGSSDGGNATINTSFALLAPQSRAGTDLTVAAAGDFGIDPTGRATLAAMGKTKPDMFMALGDLSYAGPGSEGDFCKLVRSKVGEEPPFEIVSGNHEEDTGGDGRLDAFAACLPDSLNAVGEYGKQYYFDVGKLARFIMISPDLTIDHGYRYYGKKDSGADTADLAWLKRTIDEARSSGIEWIVVGMHKNCISVGEYYCEVYQDLFSTLIDKKVDLVLAGHDHTYQRSKQISAPRDGCPNVMVDRFEPNCVVDDDNAYRKGAGSTFLIVGTGGAELYPVHADDPEAGYFVTTMGRNTPGARHGFAMVTFSPQRLAVQFIGSTPGSFSDRFEIGRWTP